MILKTFTLEARGVQHLLFVNSLYFFVKLPFCKKAFEMKKSLHDLIHSKHLGDLSLMIFINYSLIKRVFVNWKFPRFPSFRFWSLYKIENSENPEIFSRLVVVLLEEVGNFRGFPVFDVSLYTKIENSEIFSRLVVVLLEEVGNFRGFRVFDFGLCVEIENSENLDIFQGL